MSAAQIPNHFKKVNLNIPAPNPGRLAKTYAPEIFFL